MKILDDNQKFANNFLNLKIFHEFSNFRKIYIFFFFFVQGEKETGLIKEIE